MAAYHQLHIPGRLGAMLLAGCVFLSGCAGLGSQDAEQTPATIPMDMGMDMEIPPPTTGKPPAETDTSGPNDVTPPDIGLSKISCDRVAVFSGRYVEDGSDLPVENVAAVLATNRTEQYLELATLKFEIDGKPATFVITGLPAGKSVWVMESTGMKVDNDADFKYQSCGTSFRDGVVATSGEVTVSSNGNLLTAVNRTDRTLENVFIYYKLLHEDGHYFGGITYMVAFGTLEPGQSVEKLGGHYSKDDAEVVRIGWQE